MAVVKVGCRLEAPAELAWSAVLTPQAFAFIIRGMLRYPAAERVDRPLAAGDEITGWTFLFGLIPFSRHSLKITSIDQGERILRTEESGGAIRIWLHRISVTPIDGQTCRYEDRIEIDAGPLTPVVVGYAHLFYRYRQRRLRSLARLLAATDQTRRDT